MGSAKHFPQKAKGDLSHEGELLRKYHDILTALEFEHHFRISDEARFLHVEFFRKCISYRGSLLGMQDFLKSNNYDLVYNIGMHRLDDAIEAEKDKIAKGEYLIGAYRTDNEIGRFIIGKRDILLTKIFDRVKGKVRDMGQIPCKG